MPGFAAMGKVNGVWHTLSRSDLLTKPKPVRVGKGRRLTLASSISELSEPYSTVSAARDAGRIHFQRVYVEPITST
jgi:hypothetical protein